MGGGGWVGVAKRHRLLKLFSHAGGLRSPPSCIEATRKTKRTNGRRHSAADRDVVAKRKDAHLPRRIASGILIARDGAVPSSKGRLCTAGSLLFAGIDKTYQVPCRGHVRSRVFTGQSSSPVKSTTSPHTNQEEKCYCCPTKQRYIKDIQPETAGRRIKPGSAYSPIETL